MPGKHPHYRLLKFEIRQKTFYCWSYPCDTTSAPPSYTVAYIVSFSECRPVSEHFSETPGKDSAVASRGDLRYYLSDSWKDAGGYPTWNASQCARALPVETIHSFAPVEGSCYTELSKGSTTFKDHNKARYCRVIKPNSQTFYAQQTRSLGLFSLFEELCYHSHEVSFSVFHTEWEDCEAVLKCFSTKGSQAYTTIIDFLVLSQYEFAPGTDLSTSKMRVEVWGRAESENAQSVGQQQPTSSPLKGKGKERQSADENAHSRPGWKLLESWEVDLNRLATLTGDLASHPNHLPSNTLLISLSTGETLYLPPPSLRSASPSRPPSPDAGYNSDPEVEVHRIRENGDVPAPLLDPRLSDASLESIPTSPTISEIDGTQLRRKRAATSASLQDILKLINLQACIVDTQQSLDDIVRELDKMVVHNEVNALARELSEREAWVFELQQERSRVQQNSRDLRSQIEARREELRQRRKVLAMARQAHDEDLAAESQTEDTISEERVRLSSLRSIIPIMRSNLISIVSFIYPIELVSPPDLLFTILDVPLPIPVGATDPAPPLTFPGHKEVSEDSVATALGYAAQVVQLLAAYMGHRLVYPVTCVGSRSMIKDGISAMVGPRNFPLFSKGVDTYRFEYGVFLLNKDIEMLMTERDLRALDMRHTLPNLKNLLLTLTDNEQRTIPGHRVASSSVSISSLQSQSPVPAKAELPASQPTSGTDGVAADTDSAAPSSVSPTEHGTDVAVGAAGAGAITNTTPPTSGSTTPTKGAQQRKSRAFLDLAPLTGFLSLRGRYPSSQKPSIKPVAETSDTEAHAASDRADSGSTPAHGGAQDASGEAGEDAEPVEDEDDRKTIRAGGTASGEEEEEVVEGKVVAVPNGDTRHASVGREKATDDGMAHSPPVVVSS
ncbi:hypothetical protein ACG7TL_000953 [Trametes sanguinea]